MFAYSKTRLEQTFLLEEARNLKEGGFINSDQFILIDGQLAGLKTQNSLLIRLGLFLVGLILCASICGFLSLFAISMNSASSFGFVAFVFAGVCFAALEWMIRAKNYYGYGLDDAFLFSGQLAFVTGLFFVFDAIGVREIWLIWYSILGIAVLTTFCAIRYLNILSALAACISLTLSVGYWLVEAKWVIAPLVMMLFAVLLLFGFIYIKKHRIKTLYYFKLVQTVIYYSYILFYLSGNIWAINYFSYYFSNSDSIDFGLLDNVLSYCYWLFTFIVPLIYIYRSIKVRDKGWLWIGIATLFYSFYNLIGLTNFLSTAWWLTLSGALLFGCTLWIIAKLKHRQTGLTFEVDQLNDDPTFINAEALIVTAHLGLKPEVNQESSSNFGGGGFSGGGAGGSF